MISRYCGNVTLENGKFSKDPVTENIDRRRRKKKQFLNQKHINTRCSLIKVRKCSLLSGLRTKIGMKIAIICIHIFLTLGI